MMLSAPFFALSALGGLTLTALPFPHGLLAANDMFGLSEKSHCGLI